MENNGSISEFFYNIVPGSLFIFSLKYFGFDIFESMGGCGSGSVLVIFAYIICGLFLGFLFQGITKIVRDWGWNEKTVKEVVRKNKEIFEESYKKIKDIKKKNYQRPNDFLQTFYLMDNHLRGEKSAFLPTHFSSRFAFWSNMFFASLILMLILIACCFIDNSFFSPEKIPGIVLLIICIHLSKILADKHFYGFYDTILKCYFMLVVKQDS